MKATIERDAHIETYTTWFGFGSPRTTERPFVRVTINFSEEEKEIIKRAPLYDYMVFEHPGDEYMYRQIEESDEIRRSKLSAFGAFVDELTTSENPRYRNSLFVRHFLENPTHEIPPWGDQGELVLAEIENGVEKNLHELKELITNLSSRSAGKRDIEI